MKLIGITGPARSGKNTVADILKSFYPPDEWEIIAFANPIKDMLCQLAIQPEEIEKYKTEPHPLYGVTTRKMMQTLGTQWGRELSEDIWVHTLLMKLDTSKNYIIPDVRFENEAEYIRDNNGIILHILNRGGIPGIHQSEQGIEIKPGSDLVVPNGGTLEQLEKYLVNLNHIIRSHYNEY